MKKLFEPSEHDIQNLVISYLSMKGFYVQRMNSGKIPQVDKHGRKRLITMAAVGTPDIMAFKKSNCDPVEWNLDESPVQLYFFEIKRSTNKPTVLQVLKMKELEEYGARCYVITSLEDIQKVI